MDKSTSVVAALQAGKMPSQQQISAFTDNVLKGKLVQVEPQGNETTLSEEGKNLARSLREVLEAYKTLGENKNGDNQLQEAFYHLSAGDLSATSLQAPIDVDEAEPDRDARRLRHALRTLLTSFSNQLTSESSALFADFASFTRLTLADAAEAVESAARSTKDGLRDVEKEVEDGERDAAGRKKRKMEERENEDAQAKWERGTDTVKGVGSSAIETGQSARDKAAEVSERTSERLEEAYYKICERAQNDEEYRSSVQTLFSIVEKWLTKTLDTAEDVNRSTSLESFIHDPSPEQHIIKAVTCIRTLAERLAGEKSLDDLFFAARTCAVDVRQDQDLKSWFQDFFAYVRKSLDEPGYVRSEDAKSKHAELRRRWTELLDNDSEKGKKWKEDWTAFKKECVEYKQRYDGDADVKRLRSAYSRFGEVLASAGISVAGVGLEKGAQAAAESGAKAAWFWGDVVNVYLPRVVEYLKDIPIPRTEFKDDQVEFVLEDLDVSTLSLLPGHVFIRNITDVDIKAPEDGEAKTAVGTYTHVHAKGIQLALKSVSFYYKDKTATMGPSEYSGIMELTLPPQGIDVDIKLRSIPNTPAGLKEREKLGRFAKVENVDVKVNENLDFNVTESNHPVVLTMLKPFLTSTVRDTLATTLRQQIRTALEWMDGIAWDVGRRAEVFGDAGLGGNASLAAGLWSEIGRLGRESSGEWRATGTGVVREGDNGEKFAIGAEPQVLSGEKRGPRGTNSEPLKDRISGGLEENFDMEVDAGDAKGAAGAVAQQAKEGVKAGTQKIKTFAHTVKVKKEQEQQREGWESSAFDA